MAETAVKGYRSGFCGPGNPASSHDRCPRAYKDRPCVCDCHRAVAETPASKPATDDIANGFHDDIPEPEYHAHASSLSVSGAKLLLKAPALFQWERTHKTFKRTFDVGSAAHKLVLGVGPEIVVVQKTDRKTGEVSNATDYMTTSAKEHRDQIRAEGKTPILAAEYGTVQAMADRLSSHALAMQLLSEGRPEVSAFAVDQATGVMRRSRFDWLGSTILTDYKTAVSADPDQFGRTAFDFGYFMQHPWYLDLARDLGHPAEAFAFIVQEKTAPYLVSVVELDEAAVTLGRERNRRALERFRDCTESDLWPGYAPDDTFTTVRLPGWAYYLEETA